MHSFRHNFRIFSLILGISNMVSQVSDKPFSKLDNKMPVDQLTRRKSQFNLNNEKDRHEDVGLCVRRTKKILQGLNFTSRKGSWEKGLSSIRQSETYLVLRAQGVQHLVLHQLVVPVGSTARAFAGGLRVGMTSSGCHL